MRLREMVREKAKKQEVRKAVGWWDGSGGGAPA
jgi:hypothetical protein